MTIYDFLPKFIKRIIADKPRQTVTSEYWNELFNLVVAQGDHGQEAIKTIIDQLKNNVLFKDNEIPWEPLNDYQPVTVKFVTDRIVAMGGGDMLSLDYDSNQDGTVNNSDKLGGQLPAYFAIAEHTHADKADLVDGKVPTGQLPAFSTTPTNHASTATTYGVGSTAAFGHCKTIDNFTRSAYVSGEALSSYRGYLLYQMLGGKTLKVVAEANKGTDANTIYFCY